MKITDETRKQILKIISPEQLKKIIALLRSDTPEKVDETQGMGRGKAASKNPALRNFISRDDYTALVGLHGKQRTDEILAQMRKQRDDLGVATKELQAAMRAPVQKPVFNPFPGPATVAKIRKAYNPDKFPGAQGYTPPRRTPFTPFGDE